MNHSLSVLNTDIRIHDGLYSLNDLHRAAGGEQRHKPGNWLRIDQTRELIEEIEQCSDLSTAPIKTVNGGKAPGTYACKELVYAYAMWISARFHLAVIRAFDALVTGQAQPEGQPKALPHATKQQREPLVKAIRRVVKVAEARGRKLGFDEAHAIVNLKLGVADVEHMTVEQVQRGIALAGAMLEKVVLEGEYIHRDEWQGQPSQQTEDKRLTAKERAALTEHMRQALGGLDPSDITPAMQWLNNRIRVKCHLRHLDELTHDDLPAVKDELEHLRTHDLPEFFKFRAELREFLHQEIIGAGTPWTPAIARKWRQRMKTILPERPDWQRLQQQTQAKGD